MKTKKKLTGTEKRSLVMLPVCIILALYVISVFAILGWGFLTSLKCVTDFTDFGNVIGLPNLDFEDTAYTLAFGNYIDVFSTFDFFVSFILFLRYVFDWARVGILYNVSELKFVLCDVCIDLVLLGTM